MIDHQQGDAGKSIVHHRMFAQVSNGVGLVLIAYGDGSYQCLWGLGVRPV